MAPYIGTPTSRVDGRAKVTGAAKYAAEFNGPDMVHGCVVTSTIARGRIARIDASAALDVAGVMAVLTHENRPAMAEDDEAYKDDTAPDGAPFRPLYDDVIRFDRQPIAVVLAESWDIARSAAALVRTEYEAAPHETDLEEHADAASASAADGFGVVDTTEPRGNAEKALAAAEVRHQASYRIPVEHHNPMELFGSTVIWEGGGRITVYDKTQGVQNVQRYICSAFMMKPEDVRVLSPFVGGAFGAGLRPQYNVALAVMAARLLKRSVRLVLTRQQMYALTFRPGTIQTVSLGARTDGTLEAIKHDVVAITSRHEDFARRDTTWGPALYKCPNIRLEHRLVRLDFCTPGDMRAPGAATGVFALECAMDELAVALGMDPLELRYRNYSDIDQNTGTPYSSKALRECYRQGAEAFGWTGRTPEPRSMRDGRDLVGWGMATGVWEALFVEIAVRIVLTANGHAEISCAATDIGTGTYTIMAQVAADMLGLPIENVTVKLGDSTLPQSPVEGGSWIAASVSNAIAVAAKAVRNDLLKLARAMPGSRLAEAKPGDVALTDGRLVSKRDPSRFVSVADAMRAGSVDRIERQKSTAPEDDGKYARGTHSAIFAEVKVDEQFGIVRVTRIVNAVAAGRILNTKSAGSQISGGAIMGIGMALHEETLTDHRFGRFMNANFSEYHVPVNADVQDVRVIFVEEPDDIVNPLGIKGVGEIGIVGTAAAIANAIYHATGKRVRDLPVRLDALL